ncbi:MAG TPA: DUF5723 family protein [Chitinophagaceae bacterium]
MRKIVLLSLFASVCGLVQAQDFAGYRAGNYTGVNGVFFNPASIADSRYRWDFNLFSVSTSVGNNQASFNLNNVTRSFNVDSLEEAVMGRNAGPSTGLVSVDLHGPALMFNAGSKASLALTTRARTMTNIIDIEGRLVRELSDQADNGQYPYTITTREHMRLAVNSWTEFGLSYARVLSDKGLHFVKGGTTLKYLAGVANGYVNGNNFRGTLEENNATEGVHLTNATGRMAVGFGGVRISDFDAGKFTELQSTGFGVDLGLVYEFRPEHDAYMIYDEEGDFSRDVWRRDRNKYKARVGLALLDIGGIKYDRDLQRSGAYDLDISGSERLSLDELEDVEIDDFNAYFKNHPQFFTPVAGGADATYKVSLPTTLQLNVDYRLRGGLYVNLEGQLPLTTGEKTGYDPRYYSTFTLTPRYEGRGFGLYVPVSHSGLTGLNMGTSLRLGPLFIGSGSVLTALLGNSKQADVHVGLRFGGLQKDKVKKAAKEERKELKRLEEE